MFELDRTFCQRCNNSGLIEWYFNAREGIYGPYISKEKAIIELKLFIEQRKRNGHKGNREFNDISTVRSEPINYLPKVGKYTLLKPTNFLKRYQFIYTAEFIGIHLLKTTTNFWVTYDV